MQFIDFNWTLQEVHLLFTHKKPQESVVCQDTNKLTCIAYIPFRLNYLLLPILTLDNPE